MMSFNLKFLLRYIPLVLLMSFVAISCGDDDDDDTPTVTVEDGWYLKGASTAYADFSSKALFTSTKNEVNQTARPDLIEIYMAVKAGSDGFNIVEVNGSLRKVYGPGADWASVDAPGIDEPKNGLWKGALTESASKFTVPSDGLYHVIVDKALKKVAIAKADWGIIGGATPNGWTGSIDMPSTGFNLTKMTFKVEKLILLPNQFKFRYSNGWKIELDNELDLGAGNKGVKANTNFGGSLSALEAGGADINNTVYGEYTVELTWEAGVGHTAKATKTADGPPLAEYPDNLYMIGDAIGGWEWKVNDVQLIPVHSHPELFWRIVYLEKDKGFKFAPGQEWKGDFGKTGEATDGVFTIGTDNVPVAGASGYYAVVVDLKTKTIQIADPRVYLIGDAVGGFDAAVPANIFTVGQDEISITKDLIANKNIRMHVAASTLKCDWWQAEFIVLDGKIEYRKTGNELTAVSSGAGGSKTIKLNFKNGTGSIN